MSVHSFMPKRAYRHHAMFHMVQIGWQGIFGAYAGNWPHGMCIHMCIRYVSNAKCACHAAGMVRVFAPTLHCAIAATTPACACICSSA